MNSLCTTVSAKKLFDGLSFRMDLKTAEDAYLLTDVYTRAKNILIYPKNLYIYHRHFDSLTGRGLSATEKLMCNFKLSHKISKMLALWEMTNPVWFLKTYLRPFIITIDKIRRIKKAGEL